MKTFGEKKRTKLFQAVDNNNYPQVILLIKDAKKFGERPKKELVNKPDIKGWTPLMEASYHNNLPILNLLIEEGSIVSKKNNNGDTAAYIAAENGKNDVLRHLLISGVRVDERDRGNYTLLHKAASYNCHSTVDMLLNEFKGRSFINDNSNDWQRTPLINAIRNYGDLKMARMLIGAGADKRKVDRDKKTALEYAKKEKKREIVKFLEDKK